MISLCDASLSVCIDKGSNCLCTVEQLGAFFVSACKSSLFGLLLAYFWDISQRRNGHGTVHWWVSAYIRATRENRIKYYFRRIQSTFFWYGTKTSARKHDWCNLPERYKKLSWTHVFSDLIAEWKSIYNKKSSSHWTNSKPNIRRTNGDLTKMVGFRTLFSIFFGNRVIQQKKFLWILTILFADFLIKQKALRTSVGKGGNVITKNYYC